MKRTMMTFIAAFILIAVGLIILMIYAITRGSSGSFTGGMPLVNEQEIDLEGIDSISFSYSSGEFIFYQSDSEELVLKEYMNYDPEEEALTRINKSGSDLTLRGGREHHNMFSFWFFNHNRRTEIYLPSQYAGKLSVETSSGNINSDLVFRLTEFSASSTSGNIRFNEVYADTIDVSASSGNITFRIAEGTRRFEATSGNIRVLGGAGDSDFTASSGNITIENASGHMEVGASSGEIKVLDLNGGGRLETSSGNISLELNSLTEDLSVNASSGNVSVSLPDSASFNFSAGASSGDIRTFFDDDLSYNKRGNEAYGAFGDNPRLEVSIETTSGNIRVKD
jgi:hypothetical protein